MYKKEVSLLREMCAKSDDELTNLYVNIQILNMLEWVLEDTE